MGFQQILVLEVAEAKDKHADSGMKYRRDTPWLVEAFKKKGLKSEVLFITNKDTADSIIAKNPNTGFIGRVNPMDYPGVLLMDEYIKILAGLNAKGVLLGPTPEHMDRLGSKMILYELKDSTMGVPDVRLHDYNEMKNNPAKEIDNIIPAGGPPRVLKMMRGSTGLGVWKLENKGANLLMTDAYDQTTKELPRANVIPEFLKVCAEDAITMPFLPLIKDGEFRFLMSKEKILEVVHKKPVDETAFTATLRSGAVYTILNLDEHREMISAVEKWAGDIKKILNMGDVPYWWSVDCIDEDGFKAGQIPSSNKGRRLVLSEINCSCLGLVADTSPEAKAKGMRFADLIADICV